MGRVFWLLLLAGIVMIAWPFITEIPLGLAIMLWLFGGLLIIGAIFTLPRLWETGERLGPEFSPSSGADRYDTGTGAYTGNSETHRNELDQDDDIER